MSGHHRSPGISRTDRISAAGLQRLELQLQRGQISDAVLAQWIERYGAAARDLIASYGRTPGPAPDRPQPHKPE